MIKALLAGLSLQNMELASGKGSDGSASSQNVSSHKIRQSWGNSTKLEFPRFSGEGLEGWLLRVDYFFEVANVAADDRVKMAALHLEGKALQWHQGFIKVRGSIAYLDWSAYVGAITARFGSNAFEDPLADLRNLKQVSSLQDYLDAFDEIYPKAGIREDQALSFFLSGLVDELQMPVRMFKPSTLAEAYSLARLQEITVAAIQNKPKPSVKPASYNYLPLSQENEEDEENEDKGVEGEMASDMQLSLNAMWGTQGTQIMRIKGECGKRILHVLVDTGSTHNFLSTKMASKLKCELQKAAGISVEVANGQQLQCEGFCKNFTWSMQEPKTLPPKRVHDHRIVLKAGSSPINIRPYKYAAEQKDAIEDMIAEMLKAGRYKPELTATPGLLQPLPVPTTLFSDVTMDFIECLPLSRDAYPQAILDRRMVKRHNAAATQLLIHWRGLSPADASWEYADELQARFPTFLEDKESDGRGS
ncbi:hypothetical protein GH714_043906 [Hevea brasiliensis]|uniref:Chromo domain-containing protein n=1 Tax=Hevea brasiliensis TaxID=3981 RepID=A0A6A6K1R2_HEVBR|nr:hypothetical protein GH714_043906 [Hevea brasiliensis]